MLVLVLLTGCGLKNQGHTATDDGAGSAADGFSAGDLVGKQGPGLALFSSKEVRQAYRKKCGLPDGIELPDINSRSSAGINAESNKWKVVQEFDEGSLCLAVAQDKKAKLWKWSDATNVCYYLFRYGALEGGNNTANGILCYKVDSCEGCAFDFIGESPKSWDDLAIPGDVRMDNKGELVPGSMDNCYACHMHKYVAPRPKTYELAEDEGWPKQWRQCAKDGGVKWVLPDKPYSSVAAWEKRSEEKVKTPAACVGCHGKNWVPSTDPERYAGVFAEAFTANGSMYKIGPKSEAQWEQLPLEECIKFLESIGQKTAENISRICEVKTHKFSVGITGNGFGSVGWFEYGVVKYCDGNSNNLTCDVEYREPLASMKFYAFPLVGSSFVGWEKKGKGQGTEIELNKAQIMAEPNELVAQFVNFPVYFVSIAPGENNLYAVAKSGVFLNTGNNLCDYKNAPCILRRTQDLILSPGSSRKDFKFKSWLITSGDKKLEVINSNLPVMKVWTDFGPIPSGATIVAQFTRSESSDPNNNNPTLPPKTTPPKTTPPLNGAGGF